MTADSSSRPDDTNEDDWDLDDEDLDLAQPVAPAPEEQKAGPLPPIADAPPAPPEEAPAPSPAPAVESEPSPSEPPPTSSPVWRSSSSASSHQTTSLLEKLSLIAVLVVLAGLAFWGITTFYRAAPEGTLLEFTSDFPVEGQTVTVDSVETWWREPVRTGEQVDVGVVIEAELIPCARIEVTDASSVDLQVSFRDGEGNLVGDTINLTTDNGNFLRSGSPEVTIHATDGFHDASYINAYVQQDLDPWSLEIVEDGSEEPLVKARVSAERKENP